MESKTKEVKVAEVTPHKDPVVVFAGFPQVLSGLFGGLSLKELLSCTQVCWEWRRNVLKVLTDRKCYAHVEESCEDFRLLRTHITAAVGCPINGIKININEAHVCMKRINDRMVEQLCKSFGALNLRFLVLKVAPCRPASRLMRQIAVQACQTLEELEIIYSGVGAMKDTDLFTGNISASFPKLRAVGMKSDHWIPIDDAVKLLQNAPNLEKIVGLVNLLDLEEVDPRHFKKFTQLTCLPFSDLNNTLVKVVRAEPILTILEFHDLETTAFEPVWLPHLQALLRRSAQTLRKLAVCATQLAKSVPVDLILLNLACLELCFPSWTNFEELEHITAELRLHIHFPELRSVRFDFDWNCYHAIELNPLVDAEVTIPLPWVAEVILAQSPCAVTLAGICTKYFPAFTSFSFEWLSCVEICDQSQSDHLYELHKAWTDLPALERLKVCMVAEENSPARCTLDALFCGITQEEREHLRTEFGGDLPRLLRYQYCPVRPSLHYAKNLTELRVVIAPHKTCNIYTVSELTGYVVIKRMPWLRMEVTSYATSTKEKPIHLEPFGQITYASGSRDWW